MEEAITNSVKELGYIQLKDERYKIVKSFLSGNDVFGVLPTGYGKSLCYACLPLAFDKLEGSSCSISIKIYCYCSDSPHCYNEGSGLICVYHSIVCLQYEFCITCQLTMHTHCMIIGPGEIFPIKGTFNRMSLWRR